MYPYEYWDMQSTYDKADVNGKRYLEYCRRMGFQPKFVGIAKGKFTDYGNFAEEPGYWKLLIDRRMYDTNGEFQDLTPVTVDKFTPNLCDPEKTSERFNVTTVADEAKTKDIVERAMDMERERGYAKTDRTRSRQFVPKPKYDSSSTPASRATAREKVVERYKKAAVADGRVIADAKRILEDNAKKNWEKAKAKKGTSAEEVARLKDEYTQAKKEREKAENAVNKRLSLRRGEAIKKQFELTDKEKDDATKRIDERIAELHRQSKEQSLKSNPVGNFAESQQTDGYLPRDTKAVGAQSVASSNAKVSKKFNQWESFLENLSNFISDFTSRDDINADNFPAKLFEGFGLTQREESKDKQTSLYVKTTTNNGEKLSIRLSDHYGNALSIIKKGGRADKGYSIVIETPSSPNAKFKPNKYSNVLEFVYKNPSMERLEQIAKGVFDLVDNGEYTDLAGADEIHPSPRIGDEETNVIGTRLSFREHAAENTKQEPFTFSSPEVEAKVMEVIKGGADYDDIHELGSQLNNWSDILAADEALARDTGYWFPELYQGMNETHPELNFIFQMAKGADAEMFEALYKIIDEIGYSPNLNNS